MERVRNIGIAIFLILSLLPIGAYAIGISPSRVIIDFEPGYEETIEYFVLNQGDAVLNAVIYASGDLSEHITLSRNSVTVQPGQKEYFSVTLKLPEELSPGRHDNRIGAREAGPAGGGTVAALAAVESQLWIDAPYPGKYIEASLDAANAAVNEIAEFTLTITNKGSEDLSRVSATIDIYNKGTNEKVGSIGAGETSIISGESAELKASWRGTQTGAYKAVATVSYDGSTKTVEDDFKIGDLLVNIVDIRSDDIPAGSIGKISIDIDSLWNEDIEDVYAQVVINEEMLTSGPIVLGA